MVMNYRQSLEYLYGLTNYEVKSSFAYAPQYFDLRRVETLLEQLGNPHLSYRTVHVAGTKGKGSTSAILASMLQSAGYLTGLYTSPHLHSFRERIQVNGEMISEEALARWVSQIQPIADQDPELTTFEVATAVALAYYAEAGVQIAVIEVGLGGRLDATNVVRPDVTVITTIGHDHMHILGNTLAEIAHEKAGIIKAGVPVVVAPQEPAAMVVIQQTAHEKEAPLFAVGRLWHWRTTGRDLKCQTFAASSKPASSASSPVVYRDLCLPLLGKHQMRNAVVALAVVEALRAQGTPVSDLAVHQGMQAVNWPGRFEILEDDPSVVIDGAHNVDSARCLAAALHDYFPEVRPTLLLAVLADKDIPAILRHLLPGANAAVLSQSNHPRAADPAIIEGYARRYGIPLEIVPQIPNALQRAISLAGASGLVVATGSFATAGAAREAWLSLHNLPPPPLDPV